MKLIHQYTGGYQQESNGTFRQPSCIKEYNHILDIKDPYTRQQFAYMLRNKIRVTSSGSHIFQIRDE